MTSDPPCLRHDARRTLETTQQVFTRRQALDAGLSPDEVRWALTSKRWTVLRRGHYTVTSRLTDHIDDDPAAIHRLFIRAALMHLDCDAVVSHASAALLHGLPVGRAVVAVTVTTDRTQRRTAVGVDVRTTRTTDLHREVVDGIAVTNAARTVIDIARTDPLAEALVVIDAALNQGLVTRDELNTLADDLYRWPGMTAARTALSHADHRCTDPFHSRCRGLLIEQGIPTPESDVVVSVGGASLGTYAFVWPSRRTLAALDPVGGSAQDQLDALRHRRELDDRVRSHGYEVVSFALDEITARPDRVSLRIRSAFDRAAHAA